MSDFWQRLTTGPCYIIAEAGVNHDGCPVKGAKLIEAAKKAGADAVKFQMFRADELSVAGAHRDMLKKLELLPDDYVQFAGWAKHYGIDFLCSPFDIESARFLKELGVPALKIGSGELTNLPFLTAVSALNLPMIASTGMATFQEVVQANVAMGQDARVIFMHCVSVYPAPIAGYNLNAMGKLSFLPALSDHTMGDTLAIAAVAMGARIIEKHITLCYEDEGPDHAASMEPYEFGQMVRKIRDVESAMGDGVKRPTPEEMKTMKYARRAQTAEGFKRAP